MWEQSTLEQSFPKKSRTKNWKKSLTFSMKNMYLMGWSLGMWNVGSCTECRGLWWILLGVCKEDKHITSENNKYTTYLYPTI